MTPPRPALLARLLGAALATTLLASPATAATPDRPAAPNRPVIGARAAATYSGTLAEAARSLKVAAEVRTGYDRDLFKIWVDADGDGCDTREEVLIAEAVTAPTVGSGCVLSGGSWASYYDGVTTTDPSTFDIDHMVPLAEAWDSGARAWTAETRERYANDLDDPRPLRAVTASANRSKSDQDPAEWLPAKGVCRYVREYVATKIRWHLSVDGAEKKALVGRADACKKTTVKVTLAKVVKDSTDPGGTGGTSGLKVTSITYDPAGADTADNENAEKVVLKNTTDSGLSIEGWSIADAAGHQHTFGSTVLAAGASVTLHSGSGTDSGSHEYAAWGHVWNNSGDSFALTKPNGATAQTGSYPGGGSGTATF